MSKKWYNLFVSVNPSPEEQGNPDDPAAEPAPANAAQAIADIAASTAVISPSQFASTPANTTSFNEIYEAAEIHPPAHGFTIMKVGEMLRSEHIRSLPKEVKRSSVLVALEASGAPLEDVIQDAVKRDRALDTFERVQEKALAELEARKLQENQQIQTEMDRVTAEYRARIQANNEAIAKEKDRFFTWRTKKQEEEQKISDAVSYFVTVNPITTGGTAAPPAPSNNSVK
ncbi:MAG TPA: hypothetical protein VKU19_13515 [Bryobacteraceae bacterium]|nr:hypothetical protein [Bryobacteraceae bacterium]